MTVSGTYRHVVLVGLSGSGKSTIGRLLAAHLGRPFVDTDELIVQRAGRSVPELFGQEGETAFRRREREAVMQALDGPPAVIATGGGAPVDDENRIALWEGNAVVWLDAPVEELARRLGAGGSGRPLLKGGTAERLATLRAARENIYGLAHRRVDTSTLTVQDAVAQIADTLQNRFEQDQ